MHTLDHLSNDQYASLISQLFARDRRTTNQLLRGYFATNNNAELNTKIKKTAKSIIEAQNPADESATQTVMADPHILSNIAQFLPNRQIVSLELLSRRSFISLRKYPAIRTLKYYEIKSYLTHCECSSVTPNIGRFRNVRQLTLDGDSIQRLLDCGSHLIFKRVEKLECKEFIDVASKVLSLCDLSEVKSLSITGDLEGTVSSETKGIRGLILACRNVKTLILRYMHTQCVDESIWTAKEIRGRLTNLSVLHFRECLHSEVEETLFEAVAPQLQSLHLSEVLAGDGDAIQLSALLQKNKDVRNLKELCWTMYDGLGFAEGVSALVGSQIDNLQRVCIWNQHWNDYEQTHREQTKGHLVSLFKRNLSHIELVDDDQKDHDLIGCLKKGLLQREEGGNLCIVLPEFEDEMGAEMDMSDIVETVNMSKLDEFAVMRGNEANQEIFNHLPLVITFSKATGYTCCRSANYTATPWISHCPKCTLDVYEDLFDS